MRWENQRVDRDDQEALPGMGGPLRQLPGLVRSVQTPEFAGLTFHEIRARSIINKVPAASQVPFRWTLNPYRGCGHACVYCMVGDTPILMVDGRTRALSDVRPGDRVYGTERRGNYRRYVPTEVLAHWQTVKPAFRVQLEDGTVLRSSGDHRFLTDRGWKHVSGSDAGRQRRPHLTTNNKLLGVGCLGDPPDDCPDYRRGYLAGIIRGDGHLGTYAYDRPGRPDAVVHRFRLALADREALDRAQQYLRDLGIQTREFPFAPAVDARRSMTAIRASSAAAVGAIRDLVECARDPSQAWHKGFLAGIFDAEGSCSRGIWRVANIDSEIIERVVSSLDLLGFCSTIDTTGNENHLRYVRLLGGLRQRLRFFQVVAPAIRRKQAITGVAIKSDAPLRVVSVTPLGVDLPMYDITTGTGDFIANGVVSHNCFARKTHTYLDFDAGHDFDSQVVVKVNAPELLRRELAHPRWAGEHIAMGTNVDCYQRAEGRYALMPDILTALRERANPFSILTKGTLILRDVPLLRQAAEVTEVGLNVSVGSVDRELWRLVEPGTPSPQARLRVVRTLAEAGLGCGVLMAPILPYLTDGEDHLEATVAALAEAGATSITPIVLHLRPGAREWYLAWLEHHRPDLVEPYRELYAGGAYAPRGYRRRVAARVADLCRRRGIRRPDPAAGEAGATRERTRQATSKTHSVTGETARESGQLLLM